MACTFFLLIYFVTDALFSNTGDENGPLTPWELLQEERAYSDEE